MFSETHGCKIHEIKIRAAAIKRQRKAEMNSGGVKRAFDERQMHLLLWRIANSGAIRLTFWKLSKYGFEFTLKPWTHNPCYGHGQPPLDKVIVIKRMNSI